MRGIDLQVLFTHPSLRENLSQRSDPDGSRPLAPHQRRFAGALSWWQFMLAQAGTVREKLQYRAWNQGYAHPGRGAGENGVIRSHFDNLTWHTRRGGPKPGL